MAARRGSTTRGAHASTGRAMGNESAKGSGPMERALLLEFVRVTEAGALASARFMGMGDSTGADQAAVEAMRHAMDEVHIDGTIVIGEGERDEAPMLYIGERVGGANRASVGTDGAEAANGSAEGSAGNGNGSYDPTAVDIAVDPLEGTSLVASGRDGAISVMAVAERGGLLHAPDIYMEKLCVGPAAAGKVRMEFPIAANLRIISDSLGRHVDDLTVVILDRERHKKLIEDVRQTGARIRLIQDGDLSAAISASVSGTGDHCVLGSGGAPEGVLTAAALRCLGGQILGQFIPRNAAERERCKEMGIDPERVYDTHELASGENLIFSATGVTDGALLKGVRFFGGGARTHSLVMGLASRTIRFVDTVHVFDPSGIGHVRL
ncbi:MAG: Fructose-1,6-bisphosphatase, GlpX type [uncultured Chloroflexi bacterium]|uniref:Fructose-1,6-bisphosphatase n=1 Tax=uncultured Chloroflexota bacterium TaxID=166587 RepID=A0A6J4K0N6_9CHLR|nr:MAG: Fructose-1,6-bisphosphatase, GlpX type [uncultured Chloroflexota bacterium]